ncbi:sugar transferase [Acidaminococcus fermentans]|uniref:sugar transferase n=1 Tax=Acidaminococcus fermentans TaxID=905 RepID=UPI002E77E182|nr:sugar transferase [Acidaminococcus fermentans]MEE1598200.1 sugar transferase [Acidaminococcus fermentans]MEE4122462.1 sugar transferase [Acidaminococcus fermentans]
MNRFMTTSMHKKIQQEILNGFNILLVTGAFWLCWSYFYASRITHPFYYVGNLIMVFLFGLFYYFTSHLYNGYSLPISRIYELVYSQALAALISDGILYLITILINRHYISFFPFVPTFLLQFLLITLWTVAAHQWYFREFPPRKTVVILGQGQNVDKLVKQYGMDVHFDVQSVIPVEECLKDIPGTIGQAEVVFCCGLHSHNRNLVTKYCVAHKIGTYVIPRIGDVIMDSAKKVHLFHLPMMAVQRYNPSPEFLFFKRLYDIVLSLVALVLFAPIMAAVAVAIKMTDGGDIFYRQARLTKDGKVFQVLKFRSMRMDAEKDGVARLSTGENDPRVTKVGRFIRAVRFDELPQLLNILKGDMAIVGPRPERPEISAQYAKAMPEWNLRLQAKCGLTGYAQVYGQYNTTPYDKLLLDLMYIAKPSLFEDFKIIFATVKILFMKDSTEGVAEGQVTAESPINSKGITN